MRGYHQAVAGFVPPPGAVWRGGGTWSPPRRLDRFLRIYGWSATAAEFLDVVEARVRAHADGIRDLAASGDQAFGRLLRQGVPDALDQAIAELACFPR